MTRTTRAANAGPHDWLHPMPAPPGFSFVLCGKRAVVAEDQGVIQLQLSHILQTAGIEIVGTATNGKDAIDTVLLQRPDIVLMDVQMPVMDGLTAAKKILSSMRVCIIMLTAYPDMEHLQEAAEAGVAGYITKPITSLSLMSRLADTYSAYSKVPESA